MITDTIKSLLDSSNFDNEYIINNQKYNINILFLNPEGDLFNLSKNDVKELKISDNVFNPFTISYITFKDNDDAFERLVSEQSKKEFNDGDNILKGYNFRGDGRDFIYIEIIPVDNVNAPFGVQTKDYNEIFGFKNLYVCGEVSKGEDNGDAIKKIQLIDTDEKILKEKKSFFSTSNLIKNDTPAFLLSNAQREVSTGICIKNLLKEVLGTNSIGQITNEVNGTTPDFEDGKSKIFYTSPADNTGYDDLKYLVSKNVSDASKNDFSILKKEYYTNKYTFKSVGGLFETAYNDNDSAGVNNLEKLLITGTTESESLVESTKKTPLIVPSFGEFSEIRKIDFFNTDSLMNSEKAITYSLHSYDFKEKSFNVDKNKSDIVNAKDTFTNNYVKEMKGNDNKPFPNLPLNEIKSTNKSFKNLYSLYGENDVIRLGEGLNKLLKNVMVTNLAAEITVKGQLFRKTGSFISIDREGLYVDNLFDKKFLGIYFIVDIDHTFIGDKQYVNKILALKTYIFEDPKFKEDIL